MKNLLIIILVFISGFAASAQKADSAELVRCVAGLNKALVKKDTFRLKFLLANDAHYIHSNGWQQSKREVMEDLYNGKLVYKTITAAGESVHFISNELAEVEMNAAVEVIMEGKPIKLNLDVVQSWGWKNDRWQLISRVSKRVLNTEG